MTLPSLHLVSVNVGASIPITIGARTRQTGIYKRPVEGPVTVTANGVQNDAVVDTRHHGGPDQAVYLYSLEDYRWWAGALGRETYPGLFGDNLTLSGFGAEVLRIGDRFHIGEATVQITAPRIPCSTLATRMEDPAFVKRFASARRPGAYARVLRSGQVQAGDVVRRATGPIDVPTVLELFDLWYAKQKDVQLMKRLLAAPLAIRSRTDIERWFNQLSQSGETP